MRSGPTFSPANAAVQANSQQVRGTGGTVRPFLPPALTTAPSGIRKASTQKRQLIGGPRA